MSAGNEPPTRSDRACEDLRESRQHRVSGPMTSDSAISGLSGRATTAIASDTGEFLASVVKRLGKAGISKSLIKAALEIAKEQSGFTIFALLGMGSNLLI